MRLGFPSSSRSDALFLQNSPPAIVFLATTIGPLLPLKCTAPLTTLFSIEIEGAGGGKTPGPVLLISTPPLMTLPGQAISSGPNRIPAAPLAMTLPLMTEAQTISIPPLVTCTPPETFAPPSTQGAPAFTTIPPTIVPDMAPLHSVAAIAPPLNAAIASPPETTKILARFFIGPSPCSIPWQPTRPLGRNGVADCLLACSELRDDRRFAEP